METNQDKTKEELILELTQAKGEIERLREYMQCDPEDDLFESVKNLDECYDELVLTWSEVNKEKHELQSLITQKDKENENLKGEVLIQESKVKLNYATILSLEKEIEALREGIKKILVGSPTDKLRDDLVTLLNPSNE